MNWTRPTTIFERGDLVRVPYPHVERPIVVMRPALVVGHNAMTRNRLLLWAVMITNAEREPWPGDILIPNAITLGLLIPSKIRMAKITTVEAGSASLIGKVDATLLTNVRQALQTILAF